MLSRYAKFDLAPKERPSLAQDGSPGLSTRKSGLVPEGRSTAYDLGLSFPQLRQEILLQLVLLLRTELPAL